MFEFLTRIVAEMGGALSTYDRGELSSLFTFDVDGRSLVCYVKDHGRSKYRYELSDAYFVDQLGRPFYQGGQTMVEGVRTGKGFDRDGIRVDLRKLVKA